MTTPAATHDEVATYLVIVRVHLYDLPDDELDDLLAELEEHLREVAAETEEPLERVLGTPGDVTEYVNSNDPGQRSFTATDGQPITDIRPYAADGTPLSGVLLYDQLGRPVDNVSEESDGFGFPVIPRHPITPSGTEVRNVYPLRFPVPSPPLAPSRRRRRCPDEHRTSAANQGAWSSRSRPGASSWWGR